jgi:hypothetical protein
LVCCIQRNDVVGVGNEFGQSERSRNERLILGLAIQLNSLFKARVDIDFWVVGDRVFGINCASVGNLIVSPRKTEGIGS